MSSLRTAVLVIALAGCGASHAHTSTAPDGDSQTSGVGLGAEPGSGDGDTSAPEASAPEPSGEGHAESQEAPPAGCTARDAATCMDDESCVLDVDGRCRDAANPCERVAPVTERYEYDGHPELVGPFGRATFHGGDPCEARDPACGYDARARLCEPFAAVGECPESRAQADALTVFCMHSGQRALTCSYDDDGGVTYECVPPPAYLGGAQPPPGQLDRPTLWGGRPDHDEAGCPISSRGFAERCTAEGAQQCVTSDVLYRCVGHRWRQVGRLPPRP